MEEPVPQRAGHVGRLPALPTRTAATAAAATLPTQICEDTYTRSTAGKLLCRPPHTRVAVTEPRLLRRKPRKAGAGAGIYFVRELPTALPGGAAEEEVPSPKSSRTGGTGAELIPKRKGVFDMRVWGPRGCDERQQQRMEEWMTQYKDEQHAFSSIATWAEVVLRRVTTDTAHLSRPNPLRTAVCCMLLDRVTSLFGRYEGLMRKLKSEIFASIYHEWPENNELVDERTGLPPLLPLPGQPPPRQTYDGSAIEAIDSPTHASSAEPKFDVDDDDDDDDLDDLSVRAGQRRRTTASKGAHQQQQEPAPEPEKEGPVNVNDLNTRSTFFQVCRQLIFSQDSDLTVKKDRDLPITDVLNAAISRWQRVLLRIYFVNWRKVNADLVNKKRKIRALTDKLFHRRKRGCLELTFLAWKEVLQRKKMQEQEEEEEGRKREINRKMARKLKHMEKGWNKLESERDSYCIEFNRCHTTLVRLTKLKEQMEKVSLDARKSTEEQKLAEAEADSPAGSPASPASVAHTTGTAAKTPEAPPGAPAAEEPTPAEQPPPETPISPDDPKDETNEDSPKDEGGEEAEAVEGGGTPITDEMLQAVREVNDKATEMMKRVEKNQGTVKKSITELGSAAASDEDAGSMRRTRIEPIDKRAQSPPEKRTGPPRFQTVLHWVNMQVHSFSGSGRRITNFVTDFRNCHNYAYLLYSVGAAVSHPHIIKFCTDSRNDDGKKAELVIEAAEDLLDQPLSDVIKATDILKAKAQRNANLIFMLHDKFGDRPRADTDVATVDGDQGAVGSMGEGMSLEDEGGDSLGGTPESGSVYSDDASVGEEPTEQDFARWLAEDSPSGSDGDGDPTYRTLNSGMTYPVSSNGLGGGEATIPSRPSGMVTLGDILTANAEGNRSPPVPVHAKKRRKRRADGQGGAGTDGRHPLLRWLNAKIGQNRAANSFQDLRGYERYAVLVNKACPGVLPGGVDAVLKMPRNERRAAVLSALRSLGVVSALAPSPPGAEVTKGQERDEHLAFLAVIHTALESSRRVAGAGVVTGAGGVATPPVQPSVTTPTTLDDGNPIADLGLGKGAGALSHVPPSAERDRELASVGDLITAHAMPLRRLLLRHAVAGGYGVRLSRECWEALCAECRIDHTAVRWPPGASQPLRVAVDCLVRAATIRGDTKSVSVTFGRLLERQLLPRAATGEFAAFTAAAGAQPVRKVLERHSHEINLLFSSLAKADSTTGRKALGGEDFLHILRGSGVISPAFTAAQAAAVFGVSQSCEEGLTRHDFGEAIVALAAHTQPCPWSDLCSRVDTFLQRRLLPARGTTQPSSKST
eukprot:Hpha_TRINITY_DN15328_c1_g1::TRINITY_DN15328_c1_g1_i1::g.88140::m.88140